MRVEGQDLLTVWMDGWTVQLIDQPQLPHSFAIASCSDHRATAHAIRVMTVRGAPAIGATAAYGMAQVYHEAPASGAIRDAYIHAGDTLLRETRPTAQNLFHALDMIRAHADAFAPEDQAAAARHAAEMFAAAEIEACRRIGEAGAPLLREGMRILTHCNAGWLACVDWGTALAPIYMAHRRGVRLHVTADETRPRCQGANLTAWELMQEGVPCVIAADNAAGHLMRRGEIDFVITGADRIAANGDAANKIGTYEKALLAREHGIPFYIAAPRSTFDAQCLTGDAIPIEERDADEVLYAYGRDDRGHASRVRLAPPGAQARNPAFDVTPARLITGLITEHGIFEASAEGVAQLMRA